MTDEPTPENGGPSETGPGPELEPRLNFLNPEAPTEELTDPEDSNILGLDDMTEEGAGLRKEVVPTAPSPSEEAELVSVREYINGLKNSTPGLNLSVTIERVNQVTDVFVRSTRAVKSAGFSEAGRMIDDSTGLLKAVITTGGTIAVGTAFPAMRRLPILGALLTFAGVAVVTQRAVLGAMMAKELYKSEGELRKEKIPTTQTGRFGRQLLSFRSVKQTITEHNRNYKNQQNSKLGRFLAPVRAVGLFPFNYLGISWRAAQLEAQYKPEEIDYEGSDYGPSDDEDQPYETKLIDLQIVDRLAASLQYKNDFGGRMTGQETELYQRCLRRLERTCNPQPEAQLADRFGVQYKDARSRSNRASVASTLIGLLVGTTAGLSQLYLGGYFHGKTSSDLEKEVANGDSQTRQQPPTATTKLSVEGPTQSGTRITGPAAVVGGLVEKPEVKAIFDDSEIVHRHEQLLFGSDQDQLTAHLTRRELGVRLGLIDERTGALLDKGGTHWHELGVRLDAEHGQLDFSHLTVDGHAALLHHYLDLQTEVSTFDHFYPHHDADAAGLDRAAADHILSLRAERLELSGLQSLKNEWGISPALMRELPAGAGPEWREFRIKFFHASQAFAKGESFDGIQPGSTLTPAEAMRRWLEKQESVIKRLRTAMTNNLSDTAEMAVGRPTEVSVSRSSGTPAWPELQTGKPDVQRVQQVRPTEGLAQRPSATAPVETVLAGQAGGGANAAHPHIWLREAVRQPEPATVDTFSGAKVRPIGPIVDKLPDPTERPTSLTEPANLERQVADHHVDQAHLTGQARPAGQPCPAEGVLRAPAEPALSGRLLVSVKAGSERSWLSDILSKPRPTGVPINRPVSFPIFQGDLRELEVDPETGELIISEK